MKKQNEFVIIDTYFKTEYNNNNNSIITGIGDDAAVVQIPAGKQLCISTDTLIPNQHFPKATSPADIAYKAFQVNLSDMAAMGAAPRWISLNLTMPKYSHPWLSRFSTELKKNLNLYDMALIGGDTTCGKLSITITIYGLVDSHKFLKRDGAKNQDEIYVSGPIGEAALGLQMIQNKFPQDDFFIKRLNRPIARVELGQILTEYASSCIDISDGLLQDLSHILQASHLGATIDIKNLIQNSKIKNICSKTKTKNLILYGGDDYELLFTLPKNKINTVREKHPEITKKIQKIGTIVNKKGVFIDGKILKIKGYQHFSN